MRDPYDHIPSPVVPPYVNQPPKLMAETLRPDLPRRRYSMGGVSA